MSDDNQQSGLIRRKPKWVNTNSGKAYVLDGVRLGQVDLTVSELDRNREYWYARVFPGGDQRTHEGRGFWCLSESLLYVESTVHKLSCPDCHGGDVR